MINVTMDSIKESDGYACSGLLKTEGNGGQIYHELVALLISLYDGLPEGMFVDVLGSLLKSSQTVRKRGD